MLLHVVSSLKTCLFLVSKRGASKRWVQQQSSDPYVKRRVEAGLRSRAAFKLEELLAKDRLISHGNIVVDLGAAPGGWAEIVTKLVGKSGRVIAVDLLNIDPIDGVDVLKGDVCDSAVISQVVELTGKNMAHLVLSDMAPNITGIRDADEANFLDIADAVLEVASVALRPGGALILKMFQFPGTDAFIKGLRERFTTISRRKPPASRKQSREFYVVASGYRL